MHQFSLLCDFRVPSTVNSVFSIFLSELNYDLLSVSTKLF